MNRRRILFTTASAALVALAGCKRGQSEDARVPEIVCTPLVPKRINRRLLIDRTTRLPEPQTALLAHQVAAWVRDGGRLQVLRFGGTSRSLLEQVMDEQLPGDVRTPEQQLADRWSKSPNQVRREKFCDEKLRSDADVQRRVLQALRDTDLSPYGKSPVIEAVFGAASGLKPDEAELALMSDGVQHGAGGGSFYSNRSELALPRIKDWLEEIRRAGLLPDLKGVRVYHLALGLPEHYRGKQRPAGSAAHGPSLKALWQAYWDATGANVSFGEPLYTQGLGG